MAKRISKKYGLVVLDQDFAGAVPNDKFCSKHATLSSVFQLFHWHNWVELSFVANETNIFIDTA